MSSSILKLNIYYNIAIFTILDIRDDFLRSSSNFQQLNQKKSWTLFKSIITADK